MSKIKILYVEDEPFLGRIVKESLESRSFDVTMLRDGRNVVEVFSDIQPDICVLDVMLPSKDGYSLGSEIRKMNPHVPIVFITARTRTEDVIKGFQSGGNDYIRKPFSLEELIARIDNLLQLVHQRRSMAGGSAIAFGSFEFNPLRYELRSGDIVRKLSHREAKLLSLLVENMNGITYRKDILLRVWGDDSFFNSRNLDVYITKLRDLFKEDRKVEIITIKGVGYHFSVDG